MQGFLRVFGVQSGNGTFVIQTQFQQLITSLLQVGLILASVAIGPFSTSFGRRAGLVVASVIGCIGITIQVLVTAQWPVYIGRLLLGISNGIYVNMTVLYISEAAPAHLRGLMVAVFQPFVNLGGFIGALISNALQSNLTKHSYQIQLGILYIVPVWLFFHRLAYTRVATLACGGTSLEEIEEELRNIQESIIAEKQISSTVAWKDIWKGPDLRRTLLCVACATFHAASGVNFLIGYGTFFFQIAGTTRPFTDTIILQSVNLGTSLFALPLARRFGRRTILLWGFGATTCSMFAVALIYTLTVSSQTAASGKALVAMLCVFLGTYGATIGPLSWITAGEMAANRLRSYAFGLGMAIGFFFAWLTVFTTPYFINREGLNWGGKVAWIWAPSNLVTFVFVYFFLPETKGRKLEELDELFYNRVSARKFSSYKCSSRVELLESEKENHEQLPSSSMKLADEKANVNIVTTDSF
ncbi:hypothetical protein EW145_g2437 [Phellinidium pouzarii]|uniref:Major facilitator superfamily (MFS) profile domain-containing protein n=1 Tax=Phellinidium pouzarii TaxID=167371 RepID=A0A4S4LCD9_9AGAM|nr:hypothetical protein EW145_g2437 [Phellinidium pouzarii]